MSFSASVKNELARVNSGKVCCQRAEFAAFLRMGGNIRIGGKRQISILVNTENAATTRKYFKLAKDLFCVEAEISVYRKQKLRKNQVFGLYLPPQPKIKKILQLLGIENEDALWGMGQDDAALNKVLAKVVKKDCCVRAYLRGAFMGGGSITNPEGSYHLELVCTDVAHQKYLVNLMQVFDLNPKTGTRKDQLLIYLKEAEKIIDFLNVIGAHQALLDFENTRIVKEIRNNVNRLVNCETANVNKIVDTGMRQVVAVRAIEQHLGLGNLSPNLKETAELRLEYPEASLKEIGEMLTPPLGKSGVNHRMRRLEEIAEDLQKSKAKTNPKASRCRAKTTH